MVDYWNHNTAYHAELLDAVPPSVVVVLGDLRLDPVELGAQPGLELLQLVQ